MSLIRISGELVNEMCRAVGLRPERVHHIEWDAKTNLVTFDHYLDGPEGGMYYIEGDIARGTLTASMDWTPETTHLCPPNGSSRVGCCNQYVLELPRTDRLTLDRDHVTCHRENQ